jgi:hypothetical protein
MAAFVAIPRRHATGEGSAISDLDCDSSAAGYSVERREGTE